MENNFFEINDITAQMVDVKLNNYELCKRWKLEHPEKNRQYSKKSYDKKIQQNPEAFRAYRCEVTRRHNFKKKLIKCLLKRLSQL